MVDNVADCLPGSTSSSRRIDRADEGLGRELYLLSLVLLDVLDLLSVLVDLGVDGRGAPEIVSRFG